MTTKNILSSWLGKKEETLGAPKAGISNGLSPGQLGAWVIWDSGSHSLEVFRVVVKATSAVPPLPETRASYTFTPSFDKPFVKSLEASYQLREILRGARRSTEGSVQVDFWLTNGQVLSRTYDLKEVTKALHGKGPQAPAAAFRDPKPADVDSAQIAAIAHSELKARSDEARRAIEEKRRKEEEERKAKEAAAAEAAKKAAEAAKAAAAAAAAKASGAPAAGGAPVAAIPGGRVAMIYGTTTGNTGQIAEMIKAELGSAIDHTKLITEISATDLAVPQVFILGVPTWHIGEMQDDWAAFLPSMEGAPLDFKGKKVAIFGLGDGKGYPDTYVDAMQELWEKFEKRGAELVGLWPTKGYEYQKSKAIKDGKFMGLVIDVENQHHMSEDRVKGWCAQLRKELAL